MLRVLYDSIGFEDLMTVKECHRVCRFNFHTRFYYSTSSKRFGGGGVVKVIQGS